MMSAGTGTGGHIPERFRTIVYATGSSDAAKPLVAGLTEYLTARYWQLDGTFFDDDTSRPAAGRQGLTNALDRIRNGYATALLMTTADYLAFSPTSRQWLEIEVQRFGGFIQPVLLDEPRDGSDGSQPDEEPP